MKLELGGGTRPRGEGYLNLDLVAGADVYFDLDSIPPGQLPFADEMIEAVYSSHCLEHLADPLAVLREAARVCRVGALVEIRVPHPLSDLAMVTGHKSVVSPLCLKNWCFYFVEESWPRAACPRRLRLDAAKAEPSEYADLLGRLYPRWSREQVLEFAPRAAHEYRFTLTVIPNE